MDGEIASMGVVSEGETPNGFPGADLEGHSPTLGRVTPYFVSAS